MQGERNIWLKDLDLLHEHKHMHHNYRHLLPLTGAYWFLGETDNFSRFVCPLSRTMHAQCPSVVMLN